MTTLFLASIRAQEKAKARFACPKKRPNGQFKRQLTDDQITRVLNDLSNGVHKNIIAESTGLNWSTIYNIANRYAITSDGTVQKKRDPYEY